MAIDNIKIKITSDDKELISSGSFFTFGEGETRIEIDYDKESLCLILNFVHSDQDKRIRKEAEVVNDTTVRITFTNYESPQGIYTAEPLRVGQLKNRPLYLIYRISQLQKSKMKHFSYSFYLGSEVKDD